MAQAADEVESKLAEGDARLRQVEIKPGWALAALLWLLLSTVMAWIQEPNPHPSAPRDPWTWFRFPVEVNPAMRLPSAPAVLYGMHVDKTRGLSWVVGAGGTIVTTADGGTRWQAQISNVLADLRSVTFAADGQRGWAVGDRGTIVATADGGQRWQAQTSGVDSPLMSVTFTGDGQRGWAVGDGGTIVATADGGQRWQAQTSGVNALLWSVTFSVDGNRGWAVGSDGTIVATVDGGQRWLAQTSGVDSELRGVTFTADGQRGWAVGSGGTIVATADGGQRWQPQNSGVNSSLSHVTFAADGQRGWAVGSDGTIVATADGGQRWQAQTSGVQNALLFVAFAADGQRGWAGGAGGTVVATLDGGQRWQAQTSGEQSVLLSVAFAAGGQRGWAAGAGGTLIATADGGQRWQAQPSGVRASLSSVAFAADGRRGWAVGDNGTILATADGGQRWQAQTSGVASDLNSVTFAADGQRGWAVGSGGTILATADGGQRWQAQTSGVTYALLSVAFAADGQRGWAVGDDGTIVATADGGQRWQAQTSGVQRDLWSVAFAADGQRGWAAGTGGTVLATGDGGSTWNAVGSLPVTLYSIAIAARSSGDIEALLVAGVAGVLARSVDGGRTWTIRDSKAGSSRTHLWASTDGRIWCVGYPPALMMSADWGITWTPQPTPFRYERYPAPWYWASLLLLPALAWRALRRRRGAIAQGAAAIAASDAPAEDFAQDRLQFGPLARGISRFLRNDATEPPLTLAISGDWGTGKSTLMHLVCSDLKRFGCRPVWFNAWHHHQNDDQLLATLLSAVRDQALPPWFSLDGAVFRFKLLWRRSAKHYVMAVALLSAVALTVGFVLNHDSVVWDRAALSLMSILPGADKGSEAMKGLDWLKIFGPSASLITAVVATLRALRAFGADPAVLLTTTAEAFRLSDAKTATTFRAQFAEQFREVAEALPYRMVIVIDDLDRCKPDAVLTVMEGVNFLMTSGPCFVIFGMATHRVQAALAMSFEKIAKELVELHLGEPSEATRELKPEDAERARRRRYARDYMEKLINIEIPVPHRDDLPAHLLLQDPPAKENNGWRDVTRQVKRVLPAGGVVVAMALAWTAGVSFNGFGERPPEPVILPVVQGPAAPAARRAPLSGPRHAKAEPATWSASSPFRPPAVQLGDERTISAAVMLMPAAVAALFLSLYALWQLRKSTRQVRDSEPFIRALEAWVPVVQHRSRTPRAVKRFGNRVRYLAMLQQSEHLDESGWDLLRQWAQRWWKGGWPEAETEGTTDRSPALEDHRIVALAAFQHAHGEQWRQSLLVTDAATDAECALKLNRAIAAYTKGVNSAWPPTAEEIDTFERALKGVRLPGDRAVLSGDSGPSVLAEVESPSNSTSSA